MWQTLFFEMGKIYLDQLMTGNILIKTLIYINLKSGMFVLNINGTTSTESHRQKKAAEETYMYYSTFLPQAGCDTKSVFKQSIASLNSVFSFS